MIRRCGNDFVLCTERTSYAIRITETGHPLHLYYGASLGWSEAGADSDINSDCSALEERQIFEPGSTVSYDGAHRGLCLEDRCLEFSAFGKGDIREPFISVVFADGSRTLDLLFESAEVTRGGKHSPEELPSSYAEKSDSDSGDALACDSLRLSFLDRRGDLKLELFYTVFDGSDVIARSCRVTNTGERPVRLLRLMSSQLDFPSGGEWMMSVFHGAWAREMEREAVSIGHAALVNSSVTGTSSNRANPFVMLHRPDTTEQSGECLGLNLIYSGNHCESAAINAYGKLRFLQGISPEGFEWRLGPGESFDSPEAVMLWSEEGFGGMSREMHRFVRKHIVRGEWRDRPRPVLINSWEAAYFDIDEARFLKLARAGRDCGMELAVLDDGWFAGRKDDRRSLGDWYVNKKKFPSGLPGLSKKLAEMDMGLGLWIEPEMVSEDSDLYRSHPDWAMRIPGMPHSEGRNQMLLDLANPEVVTYLSGTLGQLLEESGASYVKWDMNRIFSDVFSPSLPPERQGETAHRYVLGFYRLTDELTKRLPKVLFEGCASGGGRFDLGVLCYCPQIWGSDNTDALCRTNIQEGYSYGYPLSCVSAHVSASPNHQTLRTIGLTTRFNVACFGSLGYELNLCDMNRGSLEKIKEQVTLYKQWRRVLQTGDFYRLESGSLHKWICVSEDKKKAVCLMFQELSKANRPAGRFRAAGLDPKLRYRFYNIPKSVNLLKFGDLINTQSPVHIRQDSLIHQAVAKVYRLNGETEDHTVSGAVLMNAGISLAPAYAGTGFSDKTRFFGDFRSRLYFMEAVE